jgi:predicted peroxiredoxin
MTATQQTEQKYLVNCDHGADDVERATIAFVLAVTASKSCETAVFATADAVGICLRGGADGLVAEGYEPLAELMAAYRTNGGKIWLCPACAKAKGITQADLTDGVEIAGAPRTMAFLAGGAQVLA